MTDQEQAELYLLECKALEALIEDFEWAEGWPRCPPASRGDTVLMLIECLGEDLISLQQYPLGWSIDVFMQNKVVTDEDEDDPDLDSFEGKTLTLALCAAVRAKMEAEKKNETIN